MNLSRSQIDGHLLWETTCFERPLLPGRRGGLSRQVLLYISKFFQIDLSCYWYKSSSEISGKSRQFIWCWWMMTYRWAHSVRPYHLPERGPNVMEKQLITRARVEVAFDFPNWVYWPSTVELNCLELSWNLVLEYTLPYCTVRWVEAAGTASGKLIRV